MIDRQTLESMGFGAIDHNSYYRGVLANIRPRGYSDYNQAYSTGVGIILTFHKTFIKAYQRKIYQIYGNDDIKTNSSFAKKLQRPQYLHIVVNFDEPDATKQLVAHEEVFSMTQTLMTTMRQCYKEFLSEEELTIYEIQKSGGLNHDCIFVPTGFKPDPQGKFNEKLNLLVAQLSKHSSRKACSKPDSFAKFLGEKLNLFLDDEQSRINFMAKDQTVGPLFLAINQEHDAVDETPILKVVVLTLVVNESLEYNEKWSIFRKKLVALLDDVGKRHKGVLLALNVHCDGTRVKNSKFDRISESSWREFASATTKVKDENDQKFSEILQMKNQNIIEKLRKSQSEAKKNQKIDMFFNVLRLSMYAISVLISGLIYFDIRNYENTNFMHLKHFCSAGKGDLFPERQF